MCSVIIIFFFVIIPLLWGLHGLWQAVMKLACDAHVKCAAKFCLPSLEMREARQREEGDFPAKLVHEWDRPRLNHHPGWWHPQSRLDPGCFCSALSLGFCGSLLGRGAINTNNNFGEKLNSPFTNAFTPDQSTALLDPLPCLVTFLNNHSTKKHSYRRGSIWPLMSLASHSSSSFLRGFKPKPGTDQWPGQPVLH